MKVRTRFSPSPTGRIHLGNARAALFAALFACKNAGVFILRIEDTDAQRSAEQYSRLLQDDLHWLNIDWQEGPGEDGKFGPYWQSQRQSIYAHFYNLLETQKAIYPCFCTDQELLLARKLQLSRGQAPRYAGTCKKLTPAQIQEKISSQGRNPAWRFEVPLDQTIEFIDVVKGPQQFSSNDIGDFIVRRADGTAPFLFCNAIDDATMQVTHVLRGEDHLANTPRQIMLLNKLGFAVPHYGHLSLIVGDDGAPLSKRDSSFSVEEIREQGYLPIAVINYLARLGHSFESQELLEFDHLAINFKLEKLSRSPARFDKSQLLYWQKMAVQSLEQPALIHWLGDEVLNFVPAAKQELFLKTIQTNMTFPQDALMWAKNFFHDQMEFDDEAKKIIQTAGEQFFVEAEQALDKYGIQLPEILADMQKTLGISGKKLFMPLRIALTGKMHGPELANIAALLGVKRMKHRLGQAFKIASK